MTETIETPKCKKCGTATPKHDICYPCHVKECEYEDTLKQQVFNDTGCELVFYNGEEFYY